MDKIVVPALLFAAVFMRAAFADDAHHKPAAGASQASATLSEGEVRKVDKQANKITIKHGPLANLDMPAMTMVFQVENPALLDQVKAGDKVRFRAEKVDGAYMASSIEAVK